MPGPGAFDNLTNLENLSNREAIKNITIKESNMLKGFYNEVGPKHRFTDYSKAQLNIKMKETFKNVDEYESIFNSLRVNPNSTVV